MHARFLMILPASVLALFAQGSDAPKIPDNVLAEREVEYSAVGGLQTMDIFRPREVSGRPHPAVLLVHGGGFRAGAKERYVPLAVISCSC